MKLQTIYKPRRKPKSYAQSEQKKEKKKSTTLPGSLSVVVRYSGS
jgi:hypothetical protein